MWDDMGPSFKPFDPSSQEEENGHSEGSHNHGSKSQSSTDPPPPPDPHPEERGVRVMKAPKAPSQEEIDRHNVSHCPFRSWCQWCVAGQAKAKGHFKADCDEKESRIPTVSMDYMFMTEEEEKDEDKDVEDSHEGNMPILVMVDHSNDMTFSSVLPQKGVHPHAVVRTSNDLALLGHSSLVLKSDNEPAILALKEAVRAESSQRIEVTTTTTKKEAVMSFLKKAQSTILHLTVKLSQLLEFVKDTSEH